MVYMVYFGVKPSVYRGFPVNHSTFTWFTWFTFFGKTLFSKVWAFYRLHGLQAWNAQCLQGLQRKRYTFTYVYRKFFGTPLLKFLFFPAGCF